MKLLLLTFLMTLNLSANTKSIIPSKIVTPFIDIFSPANKKLDEQTMQVRVSSYNEVGEIFKGSEKLSIDMPKYEHALKQSKAVYEMFPTAASVTAREDKTIYAGTAFHIGENLVLTNLHVLSKELNDNRQCGGFQLREHNSTDYYPCKKVHFCDVKNDMCLIEMGPKKVCKNFFCGKFELVEMKAGESLKLKENPMIDYGNRDTEIITCIGNTKGLGIHYSQGKSYQTGLNQIQFYAPLRSGNSGGPILGEDNLVWGIAAKESAVKVELPKKKGTKVESSKGGTEVYNLAISSNAVIKLVRENVTDQKTLENFNAAIEP